MSLITSAEVKNYFNRISGKLRRNPELQEKNEELNVLRLEEEDQIIDSTQICPVNLHNVHTNPRKLNQLLKTDFYQFNVMEGVLCLTSALLQDKDLTTAAKVVHDNFKNIKVLGAGANGFAFSSDFGDQKNMLIIKSSKNPAIDDLQHEMFVGVFGLNSLRQIIPNFAFIYGGFKLGAPVVNEEKKQIKKIFGTQNLVHYVIYENVSGQTLQKELPFIDGSQFVAIYLQVLYSLYFAQQECDFSHYDLHFENIILRQPFNENFVIPYTVNGNSVYINSPYIATFIDYGYSHIKYQGRDYGRYDIQHYGVLPYKSYPLFDAYKLLCFCGMDTEKNYSVRTEIDKILRFFTKESLDTVVREQKDFYFALPDIKNLSQISVLDLIQYIYNTCDTSKVLDYASVADQGIPVLECNEVCLTLKDVVG